MEMSDDGGATDECAQMCGHAAGLGSVVNLSASLVQGAWRVRSSIELRTIN